MKSFFCLLILLGGAGLVNAQTNVFPTTGSVGIGTTSPADKLEVAGGFMRSGNSSFGNFNFQSPKGFVNFGGDNHGSLIVGSNIYIDNSVQLSTNLRIANTHPTMAGAGILLPGNGQYFQGSIIFHTSEPGPTTVEKPFYSPRMIVHANGNIGIGTMVPQAKLAVDGNILAKEIKVKTDITVPDYVFEPDYELNSLAYIADYVKTNKHLPEIPSAKEIKKDGLDLAEMNLLLLKKVEELTLHAIQQDKEIKSQSLKSMEQKNLLEEQRKEIADMKRIGKLLEQRINQLESKK
ncbi:hypothetical protein [Sphingobacterium sp. UME9]|uniref:hypothetical protein n=1 Tax=Sphingobacterium sp. UME9 TaxID=1862316 RepID=UPI001601FE83|nr:hypothetical protein [Sphingobacterium sp. UME9]MBB1644810.1 hypothetical protein [Sphingobacterium sp. UME9]